MNERVISLVSYLNSQSEFTGVIGNRLFPLVALKDTLMPFGIYTIGSYPLTKDGDEYRIGIQIFFSTNEFTEMLNFADVCKEILRKKYDVGSVETDYSPEYESLFTTILLT